MNKILKLVAGLSIGFAGGVLGPMSLHWIKGVNVSGTSDAISIANTYIVFTTIIFVGFTVVLGIAGYVFTQQFSASKESQEHQTFEALRSRLLEDEKLGIEMLDALMKNPDVRTHLAGMLDRKVDELLDERVADTQQYAAEVAQSAMAVQSLSSQLRKNGKGE